MKVTVNNDIIETYIRFHGYTKEQFAKLCRIKLKQVDTLLTKKKINIAINTMLNIYAGMGMDLTKIFPSVEFVTKEELLLKEITEQALKRKV